MASLVSVVGKAPANAALKALVAQVRQQLSRRGADQAPMIDLNSMDAEIGEAIDVLTQDVDGLWTGLWTKAKGLLSDRPPVFTDAEAVEWLRHMQTRSIIGDGVRALLIDQPIDEAVSQGGLLFERTTGGEAWYGEALTSCAISFAALTVQTRLSPEARAIAQTVNLRAARLESAIGQLLASLDDALSPSDEGKTIGRMLKATDFTIDPDSRSNASILIGRRPRVRDLADGRFRMRQALLSEASDAARAWIEAIVERAEDDVQIPMFWIEGRAGDGKSVLLLQTIAALLGAGEILTISELVSREEIIRWIDAQPRAAARADFADLPLNLAYVDDFYGKFEREEIGPIISDLCYRGSPRVGILTCGPSIEREILRSEQRLAIRGFRLPQLSLREMDEFRLWYQERSGVPRDLPAGTDDRLLIEWLVELAGGMPDTDFANNLRGSLERLDIFDIALTVAATNAIDVEAPSSLASSVRARHGLAQLEGAAAQHFQLRTERDSGGISFLHPALVWPLFKLWTGSQGLELARALGVELGKSAAALLSAGNTFAARTLIGRLLRTEVLRRLFEEKSGTDIKLLASTAIEQIYEAVAQSCSAVERSPVMRLWLVAALSGRLRHPALDDLLDEAAAMLSTPGIDARIPTEIAGVLIDFREVKLGDDTLARARACLFEAPRSSQIDCVIRFSRGLNNPSRRDFVVAWLGANVDTADAGPAFRAVADGGDDEIKGLVFTYVRNNSASAEASGAMWGLTLNCETDERFPETLVEWLAKTPDPYAFAKIVERLLISTGPTRDLPLRRASVTAFAEGPFAARLTKTLTGWLDTNAGSGPAAHVLVALLRNPELRNRWESAADRHVAASNGSAQRHVLEELARFSLTPERLECALDAIATTSDPLDVRILFWQIRLTLAHLSGEQYAEMVGRLSTRHREQLRDMTGRPDGLDC